MAEEDAVGVLTSGILTTPTSKSLDFPESSPVGGGHVSCIDF